VIKTFDGLMRQALPLAAMPSASDQIMEEADLHEFSSISDPPTLVAETVI
jgi:hypothetical protein